MFPVSLDCPFLIAPSVFSNFYFMVLCQQHQISLISMHVQYRYENCSLFDNWIFLQMGKIELYKIIVYDFLCSKDFRM